MLYLSLFLFLFSVHRLHLNLDQHEFTKFPNSIGVDSADAKHLLGSTLAPQLTHGSVNALEGHRDRSPNPQPFHDTGLGKLPPEIRYEVWKLVCVAPEYDSFTLRHLPRWALLLIWEKDLSCPTLLQVCHLINKEAQAVYYANTAFCFTTAHNLTSFLGKIGPERLKNITTLHIEGLTHPAPTYRGIDELCRNDPEPSQWRKYFATKTTPGVHPGTRRAGQYLRRCQNLRTMFLPVAFREWPYCELVVRSIYSWYTRCKVEIVRDCYWKVVGSPDGDDLGEAFHIDESRYGGDWKHTLVVRVDISLSAREALLRETISLAV